MSLSPAPQTIFRAMVTCDEHGVVVSTNSAVMELFGREPESIVGESVKEILFLLPKAREARSLALSESHSRFSRTDIWQDLMRDLTSSRVVNGRHLDGSVIPTLLTSSEITVGGQRLYSLLFEPIRNRGAVVTTCQKGVIQSATQSVQAVLKVRPRAICGKPISSLFQLSAASSSSGAQEEDVIALSIAANVSKAKFGKQAKHQVGAPISAVAVTSDGPLVVTVEVIDSRNNMFVVTIRPGAPRSLSFDGGGGGKKENENVPVEEEVGHYTVLGTLGTGQCGAVRKGVHRTTGMEVAVKTLSKANFTEIGLAWPGRELELMKYLSHPNIVRLFDCVNGNDCKFLILELVTGGELLSFCFEQGPLQESLSRQFFRDILAAVDYLHRKGIVHRDLKLENCLLDENKRVKLIDFGLANFYLKGPLKTSCGSADYAAPELFTSALYYGPTVDVWAMGVMLYAMVAGEFPFEDTQATLDGEYMWPEAVTVSTGLKNLVSDMFELNADLRLTVDQIRRNDWVNVGYKGPPDRPAIEGPSRKRDPTDVKRDVFNVREDLLVIMEEEYGMVMEAAFESLLNEEINLFTSAYKMLCVKHPSPTKCEKEKLDRAKTVINDVTRRRDIGMVMDLGNIRRAVRARSKMIIERPEQEQQLRSAPSSPRGVNTDAIIAVLKRRTDDKPGPAAEPALPPLRERSSTVHGSRIPRPDPKLLLMKKTEESTVDDSVITPTRKPEPDSLVSNSSSPDQSKEVRRVNSRGMLMGGVLGEFYKNQKLV